MLDSTLKPLSMVGTKPCFRAKRVRVGIWIVPLPWVPGIQISETHSMVQVFATYTRKSAAE